MRNSVSFLIPAHNEERNIGMTLDTLAKLRIDYPDTQIICGLDGCTDNTKNVVKRYDFVEVVEFHPRQGKHIVVDEMMKRVINEIVIINDADRRFVCKKGELERLIDCFDDPNVGGIGDYYTTTYEEEKITRSDSTFYHGDMWSTLLILEYKMKKFTERIKGKLYVDEDRGGMFYVNFFRTSAFRDFKTRTMCDDGERMLHLFQNGYSVRLLEKEQRPYLKAVYSKFSIRGFFHTKVRGCIAQRQIDNLYGNGHTITPEADLFLYILKNLRRCGMRASVGMFMWWSVVIAAKIRYFLMLKKDMSNREGWDMRIKVSEI